MPILAVNSLCFSYNKDKMIINNLSFHIESKDFLYVVGSNGAGKSTLLKCIAGQLPNYQGNIEIEKDIKDNMGMISDMIHLPEELTVIELCHFILHIKKKSSKNIANVLDSLQLTPYTNYRVSNLSSGLKKKVEILLLLLCENQLLLLDEPTNALDTDARDDINQIFKDLNQMGKSIIYTTHILSDIEDLYTKVLFIIDGKYKLYNKSDLQISPQEVSLSLKHKKDMNRAKICLEENHIHYALFEDIFIFKLDDYSEVMKVFMERIIETGDTSREHISINMIYHSLISQKGESYVLE